MPPPARRTSAASPSSRCCSPPCSCRRSAASAAPPPNDARSAPAAVGALPATISGTTVESTVDADEPPSACGPVSPKGSVWYALSSAGARDLLVALDAGGDMDATVEVFARQRSQVSSVGCQTTNRRGEATVDFTGGRGRELPDPRRAAAQLGPGGLPAARRRARRRRRRRPARCSRRRRERPGRPLRQPGRRLVDPGAEGPRVPDQPRHPGQGLRARRAVRPRLGLRRPGQAAALRRADAVHAGRERALLDPRPGAARVTCA